MDESLLALAANVNKIPPIKSDLLIETIGDLVGMCELLGQVSDVVSEQ